MTTDLAVAREEARQLATRTLVAYVYKLRSGYYYVTATPPSAINADFVESAHTIPAKEHGNV